MKYKVVLVTVTYKANLTEVAQCLKSIDFYNDIGSELKIVVVDNSPPTESIPIEFQKNFPDVSFVFAPENKGFGYSNNIGASLFDSDYLLFFNNDTELVQPVFTKLIAEMEADSSVGCIGIKQECGNPSFFRRPEAFVPYWRMKKDIKNDRYNNREYFMPGAFMFFRTACFFEIGKFDENIFMYYEEPDICNRVQAYNYKVNYNKALTFNHKTGSRHSFSKQTYQVMLTSYFYYMKKYKYDTLVFRDLKSQILMMLFKGIILAFSFQFNVAIQLFRGAIIYLKALNDFLKKNKK